MNNEIKEMLEQMEIIATTGKSKYGIKADGYALQQKELKIFLDYITNLQQELEEANNSITWWTNRFKAVQQENERLKDIVVEKDSQIKEMILQKTDYTTVNILEMKLEDYKSRCKKAIKWLDYENMNIYFECSKEEMKELLDILEGKDGTMD